MELLKKTFIIQWNVRKKDLVSFATKLILFEEENKKFVKR